MIVLSIRRKASVKCKPVQQQSLGSRAPGDTSTKAGFPRDILRDVGTTENTWAACRMQLAARMREQGVWFGVMRTEDLSLARGICKANSNIIKNMLKKEVSNGFVDRRGIFFYL